MLLRMIQIEVEDMFDEYEDRSVFEEASASLKMKIIICSTMIRMFRTLREEHELIMKLKGVCPGNKIPRGILLQGPEAIKSAFERYTSIKEMDAINEIRPSN